MGDQKFKADAGKPDHSLLECGFPIALAFVQATLDYGAKKYEAHSWRKVPDASSRYDKAARRHRVLRDRSQNIVREPNILAKDDESGLPHIAHELFNLMAQIELVFQDRPDLNPWDYTVAKEPPQEHKKAGVESPLEWDT